MYYNVRCEKLTYSFPLSPGIFLNNEIIFLICHLSQSACLSACLSLSSGVSVVSNVRNFTNFDIGYFYENMSGNSKFS